MMKKRKMLCGFGIILFSFMIISSCAIADIMSLMNNSSELHPKWDLNLKILLMDRMNENKITLSEIFNNIEVINPYVAPQVPLVCWPIPSIPGDLSVDAIFPGGIEGSIPLVLTFDLDEDGTDDVSIDGFRSESAHLTLTVWLTDDSDNILDIDPAYIDLGKLSLEGVDYYFDAATIGTDKKLTYTAMNFLDPSQDYFLNIGNGLPDYVDLTDFEITLKSKDIPDYSGSLQLNFKVQITFDDFELVGSINQPTKVFSLSDTPIPLNNVMVNDIKNIYLNFSFDSELPISLQLSAIFRADTPPNPDLYEVLVDHATCATGLNGDLYSTESSFTNSNICLSGDLSKCTNLLMDLNIYLIPNVTKIRFSKLNALGVKVYLTADGTMGY